MAFLFHPDAAEKLDSKERLQYVPVASLLKALELKKGQRFLDVGCGTGTYFFPVFEAIGGQGVFFAAELQEAMLNHFFNRLEGYQDREGFTNIEIVRAKPDRLPLPDACADRILLAHVYHEIKNRPAYLAELNRLLAPGGLVCLVDWRSDEEDPGLLKQNPIMGPPLNHRVTERQAVAELRDAGFPLVVSHSGFTFNWCLTVRKKL